MLPRLIKHFSARSLAGTSPSFRGRSFAGSSFVNLKAKETLVTKPRVAASKASPQRSGKPKAENNRDTKDVSIERRKLYAEGYVYEGAWMDAKWDGQGKLTSASGQAWEGEFKDGKIYKGSGTLVFLNGDCYEGRWVEGKMEGQGKWTQTNGSYLIGEFKSDNLYNGSGVLVNPDGTVLQGTWVAGRLEGKLTKHNNLHKSIPVKEAASKANNRKGQAEERVNADGSVLRGEFRKGKIYDGSGVLLFPNGTAFEGTWVKGKMEGHGKQVTIDKKGRAENYVGGLVNNLKHGCGVLTRSDGFVHEGEWVKGAYHGQGKRTFPTGRVYAGEFRNNTTYDVKFLFTGPFEGTWLSGHGEGDCELVNVDGSVLKGEFRDGAIYNGSGVLKYLNGVVLEGSWVEGCMEGEGKIKCSNEFQYTGGLHHGKRHGVGTSTYTDGSVYVGEYLNDLKHGQGKFFDKDNRIYEGSWKNSERHGQGRETCEKGVAEGEFVHNCLYNGKGVWMYRNGAIAEGVWVKGVLFGTVIYASGVTKTGEFKQNDITGNRSKNG